MDFTKKEETCGDASFIVVAEDHVRFNQYLNQDPSEYVWSQLDETHVCAPISRDWNNLIINRQDLLKKFFSGDVFSVSKLATFNKCDECPDIIMMPKQSVFGNRMFFCKVDSPWFHFLVPYCISHDETSISKISIYAISSLPENILNYVIPRAQAFINFSLCNLDGTALLNSLINHIDSIIDSSLFTSAALSVKAFGILLQMTTVIAHPTLHSTSSLLYNIFASSGASLQLVKAAGEFVLPYYQSMLDCINIPKSQGLNDTDCVPAAAAAAVTSVTLLSLIFGSKIPDKSSISNVLTFANKLGRGAIGFTSISKFLSEHIVTIYDWCYEYITGVPRDLTNLEMFEEEISDFVGRVNKFKEKGLDGIDSLRSDPSTKHYLLSLRLAGHAINEKLLKSKCSPSHYKQFVTHFKCVEDLMKKHEIYGGCSAGPRPEPLVVHFFGDSGTGKSHVPYFIAGDLAVWEHRDVEFASDLIYSRKTGNEYFDGYKPGKHLMMLYDDFGQACDSVSAPNLEFMEVVYACNIAEWQVHMASLPEKANTYFNSKMIVLTSNHPSYNIQSMTCPEAFWRRIDLRFKMSLDPRFLDPMGKVDQQKVAHLSAPAANGEDKKMSTEIYRFTPYYRTGEGNASSYVPMKTTSYHKDQEPLYLTYDEMVLMVEKKYMERMHHGNDRIQAMGEHLSATKIKYAARNAAKDEFYDVKDEVIARSQVAFSEVEQFLACCYSAGTVPIHLYETEIQYDDLQRANDLYTFMDVNSVSVEPKKFLLLVSTDRISRVLVDILDGKPLVADNSARMLARNIIESIKDHVSRYSKKIVKMLAFLSGTLVAMATLYKVYSFLVPSGPIAQPEHGVSGDFKTMKLPQIKVEHNVSGDVKTMKPPVIKVENAVANSQAFVDVNAQEIIQSVVTRNLYRIAPGGANHVANILFIGERVALCNWHVWNFLSVNNTIIQVISIASRCTRSFHVSEIIVKPVGEGINKDAVLLQFPPSMPFHGNLIKHFVKSEDISSFKKSQGILVGIVQTGKILSLLTQHLEMKARDQTTYMYGKQHMYLRHSYSYKAQTAAGDCGAILMINNNTIRRKLCGMHSAGIIGEGYATSITQNDLKTAFDAFGVAVEDIQYHPCVNEDAMAQCLEELPPGEFIPIGISSVAVGSPSKTDIRPSPIYGTIAEPVHAPATLRPIMVDGVLVNPLLKGLEKAGVPPVRVDPDLIDMAKSDFRSVLFANTDTELQRVLEYEEAIRGGEHEFLSPINRRSSSGFGWKDNTQGKIGKTKWLGDDEYDLTNEEIRNAVDQRRDMAIEGIRSPHLWIDTLKAERRTLDRVKAGKTRVFSVGQMDYIILARQYFLGFSAHVMSNRIENEIAVGLNPYGAEWTKLALHLSKKGQDVIAGDFSNYDGTLNSQILHACMELINEWYGGTAEEERIRSVLFEEIVSSVHIFGKNVYQWTHSQPSGNPLTSILNSMYNSMSMRIAYALVTGEMVYFKKHISMISYGDDNVVNISPDVVDLFNQASVTRAYKTMGMVYTNESKQGTVEPSRLLNEVEFIKRRFVSVIGRFEAPLSLVTILEMVNWVRGTNDVDESCTEIVETACTELGIHDEVTYNKWSKLLLEQCRLKGLYPVVHTYKNMKSVLFFTNLGGKATYKNLMKSIHTDNMCGDAPELPVAQVDTDNSDTMQSVTNIIAPTDPSTTNETQQVTQWVDDTSKQEVTLPRPVTVGPDIMASAVEVREHNIIDVLERPVLIGTFTWNSALTPNVTIASYDFPQSIFSSSPNAVSKISHFTFLRANVEIRIVINANTFQAGRLMAFFAPYSKFDEIGDRVLINDFLQSKSVFPRVIIDAGSGTIGILKIPYVSYFTHYDLVRGLGDMGTLSITVLNSLQTGSATASVFARFVDISLQIPTAIPNNFGPSASAMSSFQRFMKLFRGDPLAARKNLEERISDIQLPLAQVGEAELRAATGIISSPASIVGNMATMGSTLPVIGKYLAPVSWIAHAVSQVAAMFGLSKPMNLQANNKFTSIPAYGYTNCDGVDNSVVLGSSVENTIGTRIDVFGSHLDEMDIPFVCKHESFLSSFTWTVNNNIGTNLFISVVTPGASAYDGVGDPKYLSTAMGYVASMFRYWRGSIKFKIQVTKTAYHSGRLRVSFVPSGSVLSDMMDLNQGYSEIVDLRTSDEIEFVIPYVSNTVWKPCGLTQFDLDADSHFTTGTLVIDVLNELRRPDSVTDTLDCNIWISGGDDIQFAVPDFRNYVPVDALPLAQVLGQVQDGGFNSAMTCGNDMFMKDKMSAVDASAVSIGEHVQNLRTLTRRFGLVLPDAVIGGSTAPIEGFGVSTNYFGPIGSEAIGVINPLDYISFLYRFSRGGMRYKFQVDQGPITGTIVVVSDPALGIRPELPTVNTDNVDSANALLLGGSAFSHTVDLIYNRFVEVVLPYFSSTHISLVRGSGVPASNTEFADRATRVYAVAKTASAVTMNVFKAASDDFSFGWLVGPPRLARRSIGAAPDQLDFTTGSIIYQPTPGTTWAAVHFISSLRVGVDNTTHQIAEANASFNLHYLDGSSIVTSLSSCFIYRSSEVTNEWYLAVPVDSARSINLTLTNSNIQLMGIQDVVLDGAVPSNIRVITQNFSDTISVASNIITGSSSTAPPLLVNAAELLLNTRYRVAEKNENITFQTFLGVQSTYAEFFEVTPSGLNQDHTITAFPLSSAVNDAASLILIRALTPNRLLCFLNF